MNTSFSMVCAGAVVLTIVGIVFAKPILVLFGASDNALSYAYPYMTIFMLGTLPSMISTGMNPFINAQGYATTGMLSVAIGAIANFILDPIFIFVFDMGGAVRILDVAEKVIKDGGKVPYKDVKIEFTGLRKGDKLHEKLFFDFEQPQKTRYKKILRVNGSSIENFAEMLDKLYEKAYKNDSDGVREIIMKMTNS